MVTISHALYSRPDLQESYAHMHKQHRQHMYIAYTYVHIPLLTANNIISFCTSSAEFLCRAGGETRRACRYACYMHAENMCMHMYMHAENTRASHTCMYMQSHVHMYLVLGPLQLRLAHGDGEREGTHNWAWLDWRVLQPFAQDPSTRSQ